MNNSGFKVAILISTYNWPQALELVLMSILNQTRMPDEILIADDGSKDDTRALIDSYRSKFTIPIHHGWHEDKGFRKSIALNKAVKLSMADYIIEIDGDIILHPKYIADHIKVARKGYFVQGSRAMISEEISQKILQTKRIRLTPFSKGLVTRFNSFRIPVLFRLFDSKPNDPRNVKGCNLGVWREDYIKVNGYYNGFEGWGWEDYEFGARLIHSGIKKRKVKMLGISYHIFHKLSSRANFLPNELIYRETLEKKLAYRDNGYNEA